MKNNKGFSLVELIIVIAIMAVLVTVIVPTMFQYIEKSKRAVDIQNADSFIQAARAVITDHQLDTKYDDEHYSTSVAWNKNSKFNAENPKTLLDYFAKELGELPLSKAHPDYFVVLEYEQNTRPTRMYLTDKLGKDGKKYELWPDASNYLQGKESK